MPETFYRTRNYKVDHTTFGGIIYPSDFNTDYRGKDNTNGSFIAQRIISDWKFDKQCKTNRERDNRKKDWRNQDNA